MPIYEYLCEKCEREFEVEQRITEDPLKTCPHCRSRKIKRLISQTSFVLKGSGWYSDLYSSAHGKSDDADQADAGTSASDDAKTGGDADSSSSSKKTKKKSKSGKSGGKKKSGKAAA